MATNPPKPPGPTQRNAVSVSKTYSLDEYAAIVRGASSPSNCEWLARRLRSGQLPGYKAGRYWRATQADIDEAIELLRPTRRSSAAAPDQSAVDNEGPRYYQGMRVPSFSSLTPTSRRKLLGGD